MSPSNLENNPGILCSEGCFPVHQLLCEQCLCNTKPIFARWGSTPILPNISCRDGFTFLRNAEKAASFLLQEDQRTPLPQYKSMYIIFTFPRYVSCRSFSASICNSLQLFLYSCSRVYRSNRFFGCSFHAVVSIFFISLFHVGV